MKIVSIEYKSLCPNTQGIKEKISDFSHWAFSIFKVLVPDDMVNKFSHQKTWASKLVPDDKVLVFENWNKGFKNWFQPLS